MKPAKELARRGNKISDHCKQVINKEICRRDQYYMDKNTNRDDEKENDVI